MDLSKYTTLAEATKSDTASRYGISNQPNATQLEAMKYIALHGFDPVREFVGGKLGYNSFFRSDELNKKIGGAVDKDGNSTSQHCKGEAIDLDCDLFGGKTNTEIFDWISTHLDFDQLIAEVPDGKGNYGWIHMSMVNPAVKGRPNRKQRLIAVPKANGKPGWDYQAFIKHMAG